MRVVYRTTEPQRMVLGATGFAIIAILLPLSVTAGAEILPQYRAPSRKVVVPNTAQQAFERGKGYLAQRDLNAAILAFSQAIGLKPNYAEAYCGRALAYIEKNEMAKAIADGTKAIDQSHRTRPETCSRVHQLRRGLLQ